MLPSPSATERTLIPEGIGQAVEGQKELNPPFTKYSRVAPIAKPSIAPRSARPLHVSLSSRRRRARVTSCTRTKKRPPRKKGVPCGRIVSTPDASKRRTACQEEPPSSQAPDPSNASVRLSSP